MSDHTRAQGGLIRTSVEESAQEIAREVKARPDPDTWLYEPLRSAYCYDQAFSGQIGGVVNPCDRDDEGAKPPPVCAEGETLTLPTLIRRRDDPTSPWGPYAVAAPWSCGTPPDPQAVVLTEQAFRDLPLAPPALHMEPDMGWTLVNVENTVYSEHTVQKFTTTLLGHDLDIEARPAAYTWDFGDGNTQTTTNPGRPYAQMKKDGHHDDRDIEHVYTRFARLRIALTVTWTGRYRIDAGPWKPVTGTATTTARTPEFEIQGRRNHLVRGDCNDYPDDPGCPTTHP